MTTAEIMMGAAELRRMADLERAVADPTMADVQADLLRPRSEWVDPRTARVVEGSLAAATLGFVVRG